MNTTVVAAVARAEEKRPKIGRSLGACFAYLPHLVARVFEGRPSGSDAQMTELLEPFRPHRFLVVRLLWSAVFHAPHLLPRRRPR